MAAWSRISAVVLAAAALGSCADRGAQQAIGALESFQDALFARDRDAIRRLLTRSSRQVIPHLPLERLAGKQPFECLRAYADNGRFHVTVRDPNEDDREAIWVVVRESGDWRVDLIETTRFNHREIALPGPARRLVPKALSPEEISEIATREASFIR